MTENAFVTQLIAYRRTPQPIARSIHVAATPTDLIGAEYNIVEDHGCFEVLQPDGRAGFAMALVLLGEPFVGRSVKDAFDFIIDDIRKRRRCAGLPV